MFVENFENVDFGFINFMKSKPRPGGFFKPNQILGVWREEKEKEKRKLVKHKILKSNNQ